jgi:hypothetical protein
VVREAVEWRSVSWSIQLATILRSWNSSTAAACQGQNFLDLSGGKYRFNLLPNGRRLAFGMYWVVRRRLVAALIQSGSIIQINKALPTNRDGRAPQGCGKGVTAPSLCEGDSRYFLTQITRTTEALARWRSDGPVAARCCGR